ncbi:MAG TPA: SPOR domain-containing protein [Thermoanaerobaculia bacterium]
MAEDHLDDASHYEVSLTAGQAFIAFVLLLLSLGASFAFGIMVGKGQVGERLVVRREPTVVTEASLAPKGERSAIEELGVREVEEPSETEMTTTDRAPTSDPIIVTERPSDDAPAMAPLTETIAQPAATASPKAGDPAPAVPHYAQLLSSSDAKAAEALAAKLINDGYTNAYVERLPSDRGTVYRVRVKFATEADARGAVEKLKSYVNGDVWVTRF